MSKQQGGGGKAPKNQGGGNDNFDVKKLHQQTMRKIAEHNAAKKSDDRNHASTEFFLDVEGTYNESTKSKKHDKGHIESVLGGVNRYC